MKSYKTSLKGLITNKESYEDLLVRTKSVIDEEKFKDSYFSGLIDYSFKGFKNYVHKQSVIQTIDKLSSKIESDFDRDQFITTFMVKLWWNPIIIISPFENYPTPRQEFRENLEKLNEHLKITCELLYGVHEHMPKPMGEFFHRNLNSTLFNSVKRSYKLSSYNDSSGNDTTKKIRAEAEQVFTELAKTKVGLFFPSFRTVLRILADECQGFIDLDRKESYLSNIGRNNIALFYPENHTNLSDKPTAASFFRLSIQRCLCDFFGDTLGSPFYNDIAVLLDEYFSKPICKSGGSISKDWNDFRNTGGITYKMK